MASPLAWTPKRAPKSGKNGSAETTRRPLYANGKIYFQSEEGDTTVVRAADKFEVLAKNSLGERTLASYAVTGQALLIRGATHLYRVEAAP